MQQVKIVISHEFCWLKKLVSHVGLQISASDWFQLHQGSGGAKYFRSIGLKFFFAWCNILYHTFNLGTQEF